MTRRAVSLLLLMAVVACAGVVGLGCATEAGTNAAARSPAVFFTIDDGSLARWTPGAPEGWATFDDVLPASTARQVAYDSTSGLLWYSDSHTSVASVDPRTRQAGPAVGGFSDVALLGCGVSNARTLAIDAANRLLLVPQLTGGVLEYRLDDLELEGIIPSAVFGEVALGAFRHLAVAPDGRLWFLSADGSLIEVDRVAGPTGRRVTLDARILAIAGDGTGAPVVRTEDGALTLVDASMPVVAVVASNGGDSAGNDSP